MDKFEHRAVIKYLQKKGLTPKQIHEDMQETLGTSAASYAMIKKWVAEFKRGRESIEDDPRNGRPATSTSQENVNKICDMIIEDRRLKIREIAETVGISYERTQNIIVNELGFSKVSARWVPRLLSVEHKRTRLTLSRECLTCIKQNLKSFWAAL